MVGVHGEMLSPALLSPMSETVEDHSQVNDQ